MDMIFGIILLIGIWGYHKWKEEQARNHCNTYRIDYRKLNDDQIMNNLSNSQVNQNILSGKYDMGERCKTAAEIRAEQEASWEQYKKDHPWMPLN